MRSHYSRGPEGASRKGREGDGIQITGGRSLLRRRRALTDEATYASVTVDTERRPYMPENGAAEDRATQPHTVSLEEDAYLRGLFKEFHSEMHHYQDLVRELLEVQARVELAERRLRLTRDHLMSRIQRMPMLAPPGWEEEFRAVQFVGVRI